MALTNCKAYKYKRLKWTQITKTYNRIITETLMLTRLMEV